MPWGCLCSKEKKRPQISSPILKSDESAKQQLLPASSGRRPQLSSSASAAAAAASKLEQRLLAEDTDPNRNDLNQSANTADESSEEFPLNGGGLKRDRLQQQLIQKSRLKSSNLKSSSYTRNTENDKLTRHLNNVTFAFDEPQRVQGEVQSGELIRLDDEGDGNGNYDVLQAPQVQPPAVQQDVVLQIIEKTDENSNVHLRVPQPDIVKSSTESIPYIDDEQSQILKNLNRDPNKVRNFHDARIITLTPKNVGSQAAKRPGPSSPELRQLVLAKKQQESTATVAAAAAAIVISEPDVARVRFSHSFHILTGGVERICQQCHQVLSLDVALRCAVCEFTCHQRCVQLQQESTNFRTRWDTPKSNEVTRGRRYEIRRMDVPPKSRYTDTSYLIFQQLKEGGLQCAFPAIWDLLHPGIKDPAPPDELPAGVEPLAEQPSKNGKKPAGQYKAKDSRKSAASGIPRKQSKIAEKRKNRRSLELKAVEEATREEEDAVSVKEERPTEVVPDEKKLQVCDMSGGGGGVGSSGDPRHVSVISSGDDEGAVVQKDIQVAVDFHHRPNSEVEPANRSSSGVVIPLEANNNDVRCKSHNEPVPPDSDVESVRTVTPGPGPPPREVDRGKAPGVQIRRKQYDLYELPYLTGSEYSESDFTDTASSVGELELDDGALSAASSSMTEYAAVELRKKNHEDEQQQIINKYNSLPLHAIQNQQQLQYQSPHLQQSRPASSLSHVNNNNGNHYHNYSSVPHQYQLQQQHHNGLHQSPSWNATGSQVDSGGPLRLSYVTERILASILPARRRYRNGSTTPQTTPGSPGFVDEHERELIEMLEQKHERNYRIFDLESCIASISLEKLCELCKHIDSWLGSGKEKIVVLQDRSDKQRLGAAIAAYLEYQKICGSNFPQSNRTKALPSPGPDGGRRTPTWLDLDLYSTQRFLESVTGPLRVPSHKRYIRYFSGLLAGTIKMNSSSVFLRAIIVESPPCLHYRAVTVNSEWRSFIKVYEGVRCLFTSDIYVIPITTRQFIYEIKHPLRLRGDVLVRCYQIIPNNNKLHDEKELISALQFHTCAITEKEVQFTKLELDLACDDERFPADHKVTLCIDTVPNEKSAILVFQNPLVRIEPIIENGDHLETINGDESSHTQGPLDGSLYATILKSPKSPTAAPAVTGSQQTLISPPAEFSNGKPIPNGSAGHPPVTPPPRSSTPGYLYESAKRYHQSGPATTNGRYKIAGDAGANSHNDNNNNNTSGSYRDVIENGSASAGYDQNQNPLGGSGTGTVHRGTGPSHTTQAVRSQADGRESVRSPLTLSMDSGISSSGVVNRRLQGSSVSPSSFPSQASPQDDRHRELDDLLSDMLMTVQGIPDAATASRHRSSAGHSQHHQADHFVNTSTDTIKRSHSAQLPALREEQTTTTAVGSGAAAAKERELLMYETSSTTTTLTPPPSESGRDTPLLSTTSNYSTIRDKRELTGPSPLTPTERELIMNLQHQHQQHHHQSFGYPRQARSTTGASERFTSDDDDDNFSTGGSTRQQIPYHAREDSRPFTYGSIPLTGTPQNPPASTMIKMQSGLSSPSMVRKALGTPTSTRKSTSAGVTFGNGIGPGGVGRNSDFEELLRERREKVLSEKYTIGDQQSSPGGGLGLSGTDTVDNAGRYYQHTTKTIKTVTTEHGGGGANGYPQHEPLKRSNTMDGSFGRQFSNDGISGQTWLQLQQQKLRARKEQQKREHSNSFSYSYGSPAFPTASDALYSSGTTHRRSQTLSPVRNERNYHTLTTTTRTHSTERPFVAVKRAHENAKMQSIGAREESFSSYRSETEPDNSPTGGSPRPETPAFPVTPRTPYGLSNGTSSPALPPKSPTSQRKDLFTGQRSQEQLIQNQNETMSCYTSRRNSTTSNANSEPQEVAPQFVKFARDSSKYWYKPAISREEAIALLRNAAPGTFVVRDSTTFANAYGLVVKVAHPPPGVQSKGGAANGDELVRHFLVEPTIRGVRLKGCSNEPVFTSLSALVYQHSITPLALPCRLIIPDTDLQQTDFQSPAQQQLLTQGAACNVLYLFTCDTESLTGPQAIRKAVGLLLSLRPLPKPTQVHFKVSIQGITLTDNTRQLFFRRHYPSNNVSFCGLDPDEHRWSIPSTTGDIPASKRIFAFVGKRSPTSADNQCHVFCELEATQPATAIVSFANKVCLGGTPQPQQPVARAI